MRTRTESCFGAVGTAPTTAALLGMNTARGGKRPSNFSRTLTISALSRHIDHRRKSSGHTTSSAVRVVSTGGSACYGTVVGTSPPRHYEQEHCPEGLTEIEGPRSLRCNHLLD